jgi:hypothetical protein
VANHDDGLTPQFRGDVIARLRHLACVADEQPGAAENAFHFQFENGGIGVHVPVHASGLDEARDLLGASVMHNGG